MINEKDFISYLTIKQGAAFQTVRHCTIRLRVINRWLLSENTTLSKESVEKFFFELKAKGLSNASLNTYYLCFRYLVFYCKDRNLPDDFLDGFKSFRKVRVKDIEILSQKQIENLLAVKIPYKMFRGKDTSILDFIYNTFTMALCLTGSRFSEMAALKVESVSVDIGRITFTASTTKGKESRSVYITEPLIGKLKLLIADKKPTDFIFTNMMNNALREQEYAKDLQQRRTHANITQRIHPHLLRHTYATHLYMATRDIGLVQLVLGHKDIKSTMIYVHLADEVVKIGMHSHPFVRKFVDPKETIKTIESQLLRQKIDEDQRFHLGKTKSAITNFINSLHDAVT